MKQNRTLIAIELFLLLMTTFFILKPAHAQEETTTETETFDSPELQGWEHSPEVVVVDGVLQIHSGQFAMKLGDWSDLDMSFKAKFSGDGELAIGYHFRDEGRYILHIRLDEITLVREVTDPFTELASANVSGVSIDEWMDVRIILSGGDHQVSINNEVLITVSETDTLSAGSILFHAAGETIGEFDDLTITGVKSSFIPEGDPGTEVVPVPGEGEPEVDGPEPGELPGEVVQPDTQPATTTELSLFEEFFSSQATNFELSTFAINLLLAVATSFILSRVYIHWGSSLSNRRVFAANFMLMTVTTTFIILVVRSSVALSLGLVGALSIVRFRAAVKEPEELAYLFFAIGLGIGLGDNQRLITLLTLVVAIIIIGLMKVFRNTKADVNLHLTVSSNSPRKAGLDQIMNILEKHCSKLKLLRFDENPDSLETSFVIEFKKVSNLNQAKAELQTLSETMEISFLDNKGIW
jgi:hypothetical protein